MPVDRPFAGSLFCRMSTEYRYLAKQTRGSQEYCMLKGPVIPAPVACAGRALPPGVGKDITWFA